MAKILSSIRFSYTGTIDGYITIETDKALTEEEAKAMVAKMAKEDPDNLCDLIYQSMEVNQKDEARRHTAHLMSDLPWEIDEVNSFDEEGNDIEP